MKIAFFANSYFPITYGSTTSVENFRIGLEKLGHEVHLFVPRFWGYEYKIKNIHLYPSIMLGYKIKYPIAFPWCSNTEKEIKKIGFDIIHTQHPFSVGCDGMRIAKQSNIPLVFTHHAKYEDYTHYVPPIIPQGLLKKIVREKVTKFANNCDICISPSGTIKEYMQKRGIKSPIKILPTGIDCERFQNGDRKKTRENLKIKDDQKVLMFLGRIEQEKNVMFLVQEIFPILEKDKKVIFLFVGEGGLIKQIKQKAKEVGVLRQLIFTGLINQESVQDFYAATDVFLHASTTETQGMTIAEAMAAGLAIVAVKGSGVVDQLENQKTGIMVNQQKGFFGEEVKKMLYDTDLADKFGNAASEKAKEFDSLIRAKELESIYQKILRG